MKKILLIPDVHVPYHDVTAWKLMLKAARGFKPDMIVVLGDFADFYCISAHDKDPERQNQLDLEVDIVNDCLNELDGLGARERIFIAGNHEYRLERYLMQKAPELFSVVRTDQLFRLKQRGWDYVPYKSDKRIGKLYVTHDVGTSGKTAVFSALSTYQHNVVTGHTHRMAYVVEGNAKGEAHVSAAFGWLGDRGKTDYMHRVKSARDWCLGFGTGYLRKDGTVHLVPIPIINNSVVVEGRLYKL